MDQFQPQKQSFLKSSAGAAALLTALLVAACGGDDDSSSPAPPINSSPTFISSDAADFVENGTGVGLEARATDPDGDALTYQILSTSPDASEFSIDQQTGDVSFITPPDFENPTDTDSDNVYEFTVRVSDGSGGDADLSATITVTDVVQTPVLRRVTDAVSQPLFLTDMQDGSGRVLVLERAGLIRILDPETQTLDPVDFADLSATISTAGEGGLLGIAFPPDYETSRTVYVNVTNLQGDTEIRRYSLMTGRTDMIDPASEDVILTIAQPRTNHNAGWIGFDANGFLLIPMGDGGGGGDPDNLAQDPTTLLGKISRIDITADDFPTDPNRDYAIPPGNTFSDPADGRPEIFAIGLRNPYRATFEPLSGDLIIADVGQNAVEEVSRLPMDTASLNFGWPFKEGTQDFRGTTTADLTPPVLEYSHGSGPREGRSITGGIVYTGPVEALQNDYVFADFISDNVWAAPEANMTNGSTISSADFQLLTDTFQPDSGTLERITSFGEDSDRNLYITTIGGDIFRLEAANP